MVSITPARVAPNRLAVGEGELLRFAGGVLMYGQQRGRAAAFDENFAHAMAGGFGRDHGDVNVAREMDRAIADVEAVGEHEHFAGGEMRRDIFFVDRWLRGVRRENHDDIGPGCGV